MFNFLMMIITVGGQLYMTFIEKSLVFDCITLMFDDVQSLSHQNSKNKHYKSIRLSFMNL